MEEYDAEDLDERGVDEGEEEGDEEAEEALPLNQLGAASALGEAETWGKDKQRLFW